MTGRHAILLLSRSKAPYLVPERAGGSGTKFFSKNRKKCLHFKESCDKIHEYVYCTYWYWYAMMREVAAHRGGEFPRSMSDLQTGRFDKPVRSRSPLRLRAIGLCSFAQNPENIAAYFRFFKRSRWKHPGLLKQKSKARHYFRAERLKIQKGV